MFKKTLLPTLTIFAVAILACAQPAYAQISEFKIIASDGAGGDHFGSSVSISGDYAVVGAPNDDDNGSDAGSAYGGDPKVDETDKFVPNIQPVLEVSKTTGKIVIDGDLNDAGWIGAARASNFSEKFPSPLAKPPIDMEALVTYDDTHLYLAFLVYDDPQKVRASLRDRDEIWNDDYVGIMLDTYGDANWAYYIFANPLGIQGDARYVSGVGEEYGFDLVFESEGKITGKGYQVEMAIPFSSLRFPAAEIQSWRATFWITHPRQSRSQYTWAARDPDIACWLCTWGTLTGIEGIEAGKNFELLPAIVGSQAGALVDADDPGSGIDSGKMGSDLGLGLKYMITPNIVADLAFNPDFSQVEADAAQIDVNETFALFFPERRPFFQEGGDLFSTYQQVVYTRVINDPSVAAKLTGRFGRLSLAYMGGRDEHTPIILPFEERSVTLRTDVKSTTNIIRAKQSFGEDSHAGIMVTDRRLDGGGLGSVFVADGRFKLYKKYRLKWQVMASHTREPTDSSLTAGKGIDTLKFGANGHTALFDGEAFWGQATDLKFERQAKHWSFEVNYGMDSPTFRADNGFFPRNNARYFYMWHGYDFYPESKLFDRISPRFWIKRVSNFDGLLKETWFQRALSLNLKAQTYIWLAYQSRKEVFGDKQQEFPGMRYLMLEIETNFSDLVSGGFWVGRGKSLLRNRSNPILGEGTEFYVWVTFKPLQQLIIEPKYSYQDLYYPDEADFPDEYDATPEEIAALAGTEIFSGYILRTSINYQFTREFFLRIIVQYNEFGESFDFDPLLTYRINPFSAFYLGSSHDFHDYAGDTGIRQTNRTYFFKFQYLFNM